jgi:hypothetical protein
MLDMFELVIGRHPDSYIIDFGSDRRWDPIDERWVEREGNGREPSESGGG